MVRGVGLLSIWSQAQQQAHHEMVGLLKRQQPLAANVLHKQQQATTVHHAPAATKQPCHLKECGGLCAMQTPQAAEHAHYAVAHASKSKRQRAVQTHTASSMCRLYFLAQVKPTFVNSCLPRTTTSTAPIAGRHSPADSALLQACGTTT